MLEDCGVVYFGNDWFAENRTSSHHVAQRLAMRMPVLYVDSPGMRAPQASGRDLRRAMRKLREAFRAPQRLEGALWHCTVPQLPFRRLPGVTLFNRLFSRWALRRAMRVLGTRRRISWFVTPHPGFLARRLGESLCVYYCIDDYAAHPGVDAKLIAASDLALTKAADLVFVAPPALLAVKQAQNPRVHFSPHGVDASLFAQASDPATELPPLARGLVHPVVGYFGSIHEWIDVELIAWLARTRPQWTFLLVGYAAIKVAELEALPNVVLAGAQAYRSLPAWARAFDVAIIPYRRNRQVENANPLKLREYLATGKPIVAVGNPEIARFASLVRIADDRDGFLAALDRAIADGPEKGAAERMAAVAEQSWERRTEEVLREVAASLASADETIDQPRVTE